VENKIFSKLFCKGVIGLIKEATYKL